jgi:hypothetical protein
MKRRLNYTNRRHLTSEHVSIQLQEQGAGKPQRFAAQIKIPAEWELKPEAKVYVEPYVGSTSMRFCFGTVSGIAHPADTSLTEIDAGNALFRIKVVDESGEVGLLLASAEEVRPRGDDGEESEGVRAFFPLVMKDLGQAVWKVELTKADRPRLVLNNQIPTLRETLLSDSLLQGAILPAAMEVVLRAIYASDEFSEAEWVDDWKTFIKELCGDEALPEDEELDDPDLAQQIVSKAVADFVDLKRFAEMAKSEILGG